MGPCHCISRLMLYVCVLDEDSTTTPVRMITLIMLACAPLMTCSTFSVRLQVGHAYRSDAKEYTCSLSSGKGTLS